LIFFAIKPLMKFCFTSQAVMFIALTAKEFIGVRSRLIDEGVVATGCGTT
jgi:hypothetical protein